MIDLHARFHKDRGGTGGPEIGTALRRPALTTAVRHPQIARNFITYLGRHGATAEERLRQGLGIAANQQASFSFRRSRRGLPSEAMAQKRSAAFFVTRPL